MSIPFIDLKTQYKALKPKIDSRIQAVLDHGAYINGPEVAELEKKLSEYTGSHALACASGMHARMPKTRPSVPLPVPCATSKPTATLWRWFPVTAP